MSLWLCLRFEQLPLQCLNRDETRPVAVLDPFAGLQLSDGGRKALDGTGALYTTACGLCRWWDTANV